MAVCRNIKVRDMGADDTSIGRMLKAIAQNSSGPKQGRMISSKMR